VLNVYSRSPALLGQTAATLQEASAGRLRLGVGPSGPILVEGWHGVEYDRPLRRTRETIEIIRAVLTGETASYDGDIFQLAGFRLRHDPPETLPPIDAGGLGEKSVELAGRFGDGWHALMCTPDGLTERLEHFRRGVELAGDARTDRRVTVSVPCCALADAERARTLVREHIAFYVGAMGMFYREALASQGYDATAQTIAQRWANGDFEGAANAIDDDLLAEMAAAGTPEQCREQIDRFAALDGVDAVSVSFPRSAREEEILDTARALRPRS
jgi:coenzyme F420-dependent oxidoreductase